MLEMSTADMSRGGRFIPSASPSSVTEAGARRVSNVLLSAWRALSRAKSTRRRFSPRMGAPSAHLAGRARGEPRLDGVAVRRVAVQQYLAGQPASRQAVELLEERLHDLVVAGLRPEFQRAALAGHELPGPHLDDGRHRVALVAGDGDDIAIDQFRASGRAACVPSSRCRRCGRAGTRPPRTGALRRRSPSAPSGVTRRRRRALRGRASAPGRSCRTPLQRPRPMQGPRHRPIW